MKKIIYIHPLFSVYGGAEKVLLELFRRTKKDYKTEMYTIYHSRYIEKEKGIIYATKEEPPLRGILGYKINPFGIKHIKKLGAMLAKNYKKGDIIMITNFPASLILNEAVKINPKIKDGINYFFSFEPDRILYHSEFRKLGYLPEDLYSFKFRLANKLTLLWKRTDYNVIQKYIKEIFTLSDYVTRQTKAIYKNKKVSKATELYVDLSTFKIDSKEDSRKRIEKYFKLGLKSDDVIVLSQSRIERSKGILELVDAVKKINKEKSCPKLKLLIGGRGNLMNELKKNVKNMDNVHLLGFIPDKLIHHLYGSADIFVTLARKETGGPLTILEGMYAGAIVIGTNEAGPPELIDEGKTGFLADPDNQKEIASKIKKAYGMTINKNKQYRDIIKKAKEQVKNKYNFKNFYRMLTSALIKK